MHSIRLNVDDSVYSQFLSFVNQFNTNELTLVEDTKKESFIVSSEEEVRNRVQKAEANADYIAHDTFWSDIDKQIKDI
jgi:hypothetical protein